VATVLATEIITLIKQLNETSSILCRLLKGQTRQCGELKETIANVETTVEEIKLHFIIETGEKGRQKTKK
jgi:hypothetical protein